MPFMALTATASLESVNNIKLSLNMKNCKVIRANPDRKNVFLIKEMRGDSIYGKSSYDKILIPIAENLKIHRQKFPQTLIYLKLEYCAYAYALFSRIINNIYEGEDKVVSNCLIAQFHASQTDLMKNEILKELLKEDSNIRVVFSTSALSMGVNMPFVTRIVHISPPSSLEEYVQEIGRAGRSGLQSYAYLYFCNSDISQHRITKGYVSEAMAEYCRNAQCLRECLLNYFSFNKMSNQSYCCNYCTPEFQEDLKQKIQIKYTRAIDESNLEKLTTELNDLIAEKDALSDSGDFLSLPFCGNDLTTDSFSDKVMAVLENIKDIIDENDVICHGIINSKDSKNILKLIKKYSVLSKHINS